MLYGKPVREKILNITREKVRDLNQKGVNPTLSIVGMEQDEEANTYLRNIRRTAIAAGIDLEEMMIQEPTPSVIVDDIVYGIAKDAKVSGMLILQPLPKAISIQQLLKRIPPEKDVDGASEKNLGRLIRKSPNAVLPATARAVLETLDYYGCDVSGKDVTVIGRSLVTGRPLAQALVNRDATVTLCHSKTTDLRAHTETADVVISCTGVPDTITPDMVPYSTWVIDVGTTVCADGTLQGDASPTLKNENKTPVPGGIGAVTTAALMLQVAEAAERRTNA